MKRITKQNENYHYYKINGLTGQKENEKIMSINEIRDLFWIAVIDILERIETIDVFDDEINWFWY